MVSHVFPTPIFGDSRGTGKIGKVPSRSTRLYENQCMAKLGAIFESENQLIGLRGKLQENPIFHGKIYGFL